MTKGVAADSLGHTFPGYRFPNGPLQNSFVDMVPSFFSGYLVFPVIFLRKDPLPVPDPGCLRSAIFLNRPFPPICHTPSKRTNAPTKNATDRHDADAVAFDIQCDVFLIFSPPENAIMS